MAPRNRRALLTSGLTLLGSTALIACAPRDEPLTSASLRDAGTAGTAGTGDALTPKARQLLGRHGIRAATADGTTAGTPFDSGSDGPTCLTTLHLT